MLLSIRAIWYVTLNPLNQVITPLIFHFSPAPLDVQALLSL